MAPTIRIDDEVYAWLQENGKPFEDTPNSVLRRLAGLDLSTQEPKQGSTTDGTNDEKTHGSGSSISSRGATMGRRPIQITGRQLNDEWQVGARHALFHSAGCWYNNLERFPGARFEPNGYVLFQTKEDYTNCPHLRIGKETNVPKGISSIPNYVPKT